MKQDELEIETQKISAVYKSLYLSQSCFKTYEDFLHQKRMHLDSFIFESLKKMYGPTLKNFWDTTDTIPFESDKAIIIVERRCHPNLDFILQCNAYFARGFTIHIFCSEANYSYIELICGVQYKNIHCHKVFETIGTPEEGKIEYNNLLKTKSFWETFTEEHIITIETDSYLLKPISDLIYTFDYVGSAWPWQLLDPGGGGLTYRKTSVMKQICDLSGIDCPMQDSFASNGIKKLGLKFSNTYFTESIFMYTSFGTHQWWTHLDYDEETELKIRHYLTLCL